MKARTGNFRSDPTGDHIHNHRLCDDFYRVVVSVGRVSADRRSHAERIAVVRAVHYLLPLK